MRLFFIIAGLSLCASCSSSIDETPHGRAEIKSVMAQQEQAWNDGDLEAFMEPYWQNDSLLFIGSRGPTYGWSTTLSNYEKSYPTPEKMGELKFTNIRFKPIEKHHYWVAGQWTLYRTSDTLSGHYTLVWEKTKNGWKIISDHSS